MYAAIGANDIHGAGGAADNLIEYAGGGCVGNRLAYAIAILTLPGE